MTSVSKISLKCLQLETWFMALIFRTNRLIQQGTSNHTWTNDTYDWCSKHNGNVQLLRIFSDFTNNNKFDWQICKVIYKIFVEYIVRVLYISVHLSINWKLVHTQKAYRGAPILPANTYIEKRYKCSNGKIFNIQIIVCIMRINWDQNILNN